MFKFSKLYIIAKLIFRFEMVYRIFKSDNKQENYETKYQRAITRKQVASEFSVMETDGNGGLQILLYHQKQKWRFHFHHKQEWNFHFWPFPSKPVFHFPFSLSPPRSNIHYLAWVGGPTHAERKRARGLALEVAGWEDTARWAWHWSVHIPCLLKDLIIWIAMGDPEVANSVAPDTPLLNKSAHKSLWWWVAARCDQTSTSICVICAQVKLLLYVIPQVLW